ncbi:MAG: hypothetical protein ACREIJ_08980 [Nitrospiraceae bacterium]
MTQVPKASSGRTVQLTLLGLLILVTLETLGCGTTPQVVGLRPEQPPLDTTRMESLRPMLRWESFPRPADNRELGAGSNSRITSTSYDLKIWKTGEGYQTVRSGVFGANSYSAWRHEARDRDPGDLVYAREGLPNPFHLVDTLLEPGTQYYWSVRARFQLDGRDRATEWSERVAKMASMDPWNQQSGGTGMPGSVSYHVFWTPEEPEKPKE